MGDDGNGFADVVEDDHAVVEGERQVGQAAIVGRRVGQPFDVANSVVARVSHRAATEARQSRQIGRAVSRQTFLKQKQRVRVFQLRQRGGGGRGAGRRGVDAYLRSVCLEAKEGAGADEAVSTQALA